MSFAFKTWHAFTYMYNAIPEVSAELSHDSVY